MIVPHCDTKVFQIFLDTVAAPLKSHVLAGYITKYGDQINETIFISIRALLEEPEIKRSACKTRTKQRHFLLAMGPGSNWTPQ